MQFLSVGQVPVYIGAQCGGAIVASFVLRAILNSEASEGATLPAGSDVQSFVLEIIITFILMFVVSAVATDTRAVRFSSYCFPYKDSWECILRWNCFPFFASQLFAHTCMEISSSWWFFLDSTLVADRFDLCFMFVRGTDMLIFFDMFPIWLVTIQDLSVAGGLGQWIHEVDSHDSVLSLLLFSPGFWFLAGWWVSWNCSGLCSRSERSYGRVGLLQPSLHLWDTFY